MYSQDHPKRTSADIWNSETTENLNIYLYNYQTETAIFLAAKHKKQLWHAVINFFKKYFLHFELLASNTIKMKVFIQIPGTISHKK